MAVGWDVRPWTAGGGFGVVVFVGWRDHVRADPLPWLLAEDTPAVRAATLQRLCGEASDVPRVVAARTAAMGTEPITSILAAQDPAGWWVKPGPG